MPGPTYAIWGGIEFTRGFDFTFSPGVVPSACIINTVPHTETLATDGDLILKTDGPDHAAEIVFRDCKLEAPQLDVGQNGAYWRLPILDRRWKWQFAFVYGSYNIPKPDGTYLREKTPQEIAAILFQEMGEADADVSRLPNDARPECNWSDGAEAATELDKLVSSLGCVIVLNHTHPQQRVEIWPVGDTVGELPSTYPAAPISGRSYTPVQLAKPKKLRVDAGPTLFQDSFLLEAVGLDTDGTFKLIDDLIHKPAGYNWQWPPTGFSQLRHLNYTEYGQNLKVRDLYEQHVFRTYRIYGLRSGGWVPTFMQFSDQASHPASLKDFRLYDELVDEEISTADGGLRKLPARIYAKWWREGRQDMTTPQLYPHSFSFDTTHGLVHFHEPVFERLGGPVPAYVRLECSFNCGSGGVWHRLSTPLDELDLGDIETPTRVIQRPDIFLRIVQRYDNDTGTPEREDNTGDAQQRLKYWRDAAVTEYDELAGGTLNYKRLMTNIQLDGLTQQITWSGGGGREPNTTVSQARRHNRYIPRLDEYRDRLAAKKAERQLTTILVQQTLAGAFI